MMMGIYATLGVFLIMAVKDPMANESLIWFTVWSSFVHGGIMAVQAPSIRWIESISSVISPGSKHAVAGCASA